MFFGRDGEYYYLANQSPVAHLWQEHVALVGHKN